MIDKGVFDKGFVWNPSNCECECDNSCNIVEYLEHENCKCRKKVVDKRLKNVLKLAKITLAKNENKHKWSSCALYIVLFSMIFTINVRIGTYFVYYKYMNCDAKERFYFSNKNY